MSLPSDVDVLVLGGGPAGMSAALAAHGRGASVLLVDERPTLGGQVYKQPSPGIDLVEPRALGRQARAGRELVERVAASAVVTSLGTELVAASGWGGDEGGQAVLVVGRRDQVTVRARRLVVAAGAHDRPVVFPGWTLPGVMTAGGVQSLAKTQLMVPAGRVVFAGSGPVALAFPAQLARLGADVVTVLEAGPRPGVLDLLRLVAAAPGNLDVLVDAAGYLGAILRRRVPVHHGRKVVRAEGDGRLERVVHCAVDESWRPVPGTERVEAADLLCLGYGFQPSVELARLLGCAIDEEEDLGGPVVRRDPWTRTSVTGVYAAGDGAGVEGVWVARDEGRLAGLAAVVDLGLVTRRAVRAEASRARARIARRRRLREATARLYRVGAGIDEAATPETIVCRCESVRQGELDRAIAASADPNVVKALTRAGMGPCQGRSCGRHVQAALARAHHVPRGELPAVTARIPLRPVPLGALADRSVTSPGLFLADGDGPR